MRASVLSCRHICLCLLTLAGCVHSESTTRPSGFSSTQFRYSLERQKELAEAAQRAQVRGTYQAVDAVPAEKPLDPSPGAQLQSSRGTP